MIPSMGLGGSAGECSAGTAGEAAGARGAPSSAILGANVHAVPMSFRHLQRASLALAVALPAPAALAQQPLMPISASGKTVTPVFEGWYVNPDGSYSISCGYFNRNSEEVLHTPVGPDKSVTPGDPNQGQPTHFEARRHWGVFAV